PSRNEAADQRPLVGNRSKKGSNTHARIGKRARERTKDTGLAEKGRVVACPRLVHIIIHIGAGGPPARPGKIEFGALARSTAAAAGPNLRDRRAARGFHGRSESQGQKVERTHAMIFASRKAAISASE